MLQRTLLAISLIFLPLLAWADADANQVALNLTRHWVGYLSIAIFALAYMLAMTEEITELNKSKPMVLAASLIWAFIASIYVQGGMGEQAGRAFRACLESYAELFLFIMVSMAYLNAMESRGVFDNLRVWLLSKGFSYRKLFWITGVMSFFMSSVCNNLTTALLMGAVIVAMGKHNKRFMTMACINVVVATNAGGSFSPFGDITTLLVWQSGVVPFVDFYSLFIPAVVNFALPAAVMHFWIPNEHPAAVGKAPKMKRGALTMMVLFLLTIITAVSFENFLDLPPAAGMLAGLTYLKFLGYYLQKTEDKQKVSDFAHVYKLFNVELPLANQNQRFDVFKNVANLEWDTLLFFYGVMVSVGGLSFIGYLTMASDVLYVGMDPTIANIVVGILSAFIDNGTIMFAVLTMHPEISQGQWLLVTLTAGVGGSLLAIGSAAGVGLMGQVKGVYTFSAHLKWMPVILLGYAGSIAAHFLLNSHYF
ncbi:MULTISPECIES: sodium:proton antiporter NhaD [unclassified Methylomonas]|uniref:sodium:proton antiporter NhaD n=2 Tax=unclassified Methylomonas TaxID=2608980 RepID=UPI000A755DD3|nr:MULTISPECIES: sodium:proton antiporter NhaD [unclassified Methylomonas]MDT4330119.1 sodium:proton antiporter NhaD [Methylomonas sp. MV1]WGS86750.1 sodium:proton antiporter NhaD [Methylomonas sp. UP202]